MKQTITLEHLDVLKFYFSAVKKISWLEVLLLGLLLLSH